MIHRAASQLDALGKIHWKHFPGNFSMRRPSYTRDEAVSLECISTAQFALSLWLNSRGRHRGNGSEGGLTRKGGWNFFSSVLVLTPLFSIAKGRDKKSKATTVADYPKARTFVQISNRDARFFSEERNTLQHPRLKSAPPADKKDETQHQLQPASQPAGQLQKGQS